MRGHDLADDRQAEVAETQCIAGAAGTGEPGALLRCGSFFSGSLAGPLAVLASNPPSGSNNGIGFRCTR